MSCIKLRLKEIPNENPIFLDDDGYFYLDLTPTAELSLTKQLSELSEINSISFDYVLNIDLPATPKNIHLLSKFHHAQNGRLPLSLFTGNIWYSGIYLTVEDASKESIAVNFILTDLFWAKKLSETYVKDMILFPMLNTDALQANGSTPLSYKYVDGLRPFYYPLVDYGDLRLITGRSHRDVAFINPKGEKSTVCKDVAVIISSTVTNNKVRVYVTDNILSILCLDGWFTGLVVVNGKTFFTAQSGLIKIPLGEFTSPITVTVSLVRVKVFIIFTQDFAVNGTINIIKGASKTNTVGPLSVNMDDLRPWFFPLPIIRKMFCDIGFTLVSPILESDYGRRLLTYILDPNLHEDNSRKFRIRQPLATGTADIGDRPKTIFQFNERGVFDIKINIAGYFEEVFSTKTAGDTTEDTIAGIYAWVFEGEEPIQYVGSNIVYNGTIGPYIETIEATEVIIKIGQSLRVWTAGKNSFLTIFDSIEEVPDIEFACNASPEVKFTEFFATRSAKFFWSDYGKNELGNNNVLISATSIIDRELTNLEYLKSIAHILNLKFYTDINTKKVYALQPHDVDLYGEVLDGFYEHTDLNIPLLPDTYKVDATPTDVKWHELKFKGTDLFSYKIDVSPENSKGETVTSENPLFKAIHLQEYGVDAVSKGIGKLYKSTTSGNYYFPTSVDVPELSDTDTYRPEYGEVEHGVIQGKQPKSIAPKFDQDPMILLSYGRRLQQYTQGLNTKVHGGNLIVSGLWAMAVHYHPSLSIVEGSVAAASTDFATTDKTLVFKFVQGTGDFLRRFSRNLTEMLHYEWIINLYRGLKVQYLVNDNSKQFFENTLRNIYTIQHLGKPYNVYIESIEDFKTCTISPTIYNLKGLTAVNPICEIYTETEIETEWRGGGGDECEAFNQPAVKIDYEIVNDVIKLTLSGLNTSPVSAVQFEYSTDLVVWTPADNTSIITAIIPNASSFTLLYVRAIVEYADDCNVTISTPISVAVCPFLQTDRFDASIYQKPNGDVCVKATITIPVDVTYTIVSFTIDTNGTPVPYTNDTEICGITGDVTFTLVTAINDCPDETQVIVLEYETPDECPDASTIGLICVDGILFEKTGVLPVAVVITDIIYYQTSVDGINWGTEWIIWYGDPIGAPFIRARRVVTLCDCPPICTPIIYCEQDCTAVFTIECNDCTLTVVGDLTGCTIAWSGTDTGVGNDFPVSIEGPYTATITCGLCVYTVNYTYDIADAGTPIADPIIISE